MKKKFCPQCGREETEENPLIDDLCKRCSKIKLLEGYKDPKIRICSNCGSYFFRGKLLLPLDENFEENVRKIIIEMLKPKIKFYSEAKISKLEIKPIFPETFHHAPGNNPTIDIKISVTGTVSSKKIKEDYTIPLKIHFISCKRCSLQHTKYYEAILQIRPYSEKVLRFVKSLIKQRKDVFITQEKELKEGIDLYITSQRYTRALISKLKHKFHGETKVSKKLFSQRKDGKKLYRTTFLFRLSKPL